MNVGELRKKLKNVPDDTRLDVWVEGADLYPIKLVDIFYDYASKEEEVHSVQLNIDLNISEFYKGNNDDWCETHYHISNIIENCPLDITQGERCELAQKLTNEFQTIHDNTDLNGEYFARVEAFVEQQLKD